MGEGRNYRGKHCKSGDYSRLFGCPVEAEITVELWDQALKLAKAVKVRWSRDLEISVELRDSFCNQALKAVKWDGVVISTTTSLGGMVLFGEGGGGVWCMVLCMYCIFGEGGLGGGGMVLCMYCIFGEGGLGGGVWYCVCTVYLENVGGGGGGMVLCIYCVVGGGGGMWMAEWLRHKTWDQVIVSAVNSKALWALVRKGAL